MGKGFLWGLVMYATEEQSIGSRIPFNLYEKN